MFWVAGLESQGGVPQAGSCVTLPVQEISPIDQPLGLASDPFPLSLLSVIINLRINGIEG